MDDDKSLTLDANPLPSDDPDNGADFDVVADSNVPPEEDTSLPTLPTSASKPATKFLVEAAFSAEGGLELSPLPKPKKVAKAAPMSAMDALRPFLRFAPAGEDSDVVEAPKPLPLDLRSLQSSLKRSNSRPPSKSWVVPGTKGPEENKRTGVRYGFTREVLLLAMAFSNSDGTHLKSLWPAVDRFIWHDVHRTEWTDAWDSVAIFTST